jgi:SPP1 gp7 family putative phage head morphogenesis protein
MAFTATVLGLARAATQAAGRVVDATVRALTAAWAAAWNTLAPAFTAVLENFLAGAERWPARAQIDKDTGMQRVMAGAARVLRVLAGMTASEATEAAHTLTRTAVTDQATIIAAQLPPGRTAPARPGGFHQQAINAITVRSRQRIVSLTRPLAKDADAAMRRELVRGVRLGENPRESARRMVRQVEGAFNGGLSRALVIARTETISAYREAAAAVQDASTDVLAGWVWMAELSARTCPACWAMHGTEHPLSEPGPQGHPQCRCARSPKTRSWRDLGFDLDEPDDVIPDARTVFDALPRDEQLRIMGATRLSLLERGDITWADLVRRRENPGWRPSFMSTPVKELAGR